MCFVCFLEHRAALFTDLMCLAGVQALRTDVSDTRVFVPSVVPVEEPTQKRLRILNASE